MIVVSLDLEFNQPSGKIIELGYTIGNIYTGEILLNKGLIVNCNENLSEYIIKLTSITQNDVANGSTLSQAYEEFLKDCEKFNCHRQPIVWGSGDVRALKQQIYEIESSILERNWKFGFTEMNVKNIVQAFLLSKKMKSQGGLAKSLIKFGLKFKGVKHRAKDDSANTFLLYVELLRRLEKLNL